MTVTDDVADLSNLDDPLLFFSKAPVIACMGGWTSDKLTLKISENDGNWIMKSGKRELVVKTTENATEWSVYESAAMEKELYVASVAGYGPRTRLTMRPGKQHAGSGKKLMLWRNEHTPEDSEADKNDEIEGNKKYTQAEADAAARRREDSPGLIGDGNDEARDSGLRGKGGKGNGRRQERGRQAAGKGGGVEMCGDFKRGKCTRGDGCKFSHGDAGQGRRGGNRGRSPSYSRSRSRSGSRSRSRSRRPRGRSPPWRSGKQSGKPAEAPGKGNEEVTTIFLQKLADDAAEDEVRGDLEGEGDIQTVIVMKQKGGDRNAFVRFATLREATRCLERIADGKVRVCGETNIKAEMARRNSN